MLVVVDVVVVEILLEDELVVVRVVDVEVTVVDVKDELLLLVVVVVLLVVVLEVVVVDVCVLVVVSPHASGLPGRASRNVYNSAPLDVCWLHVSSIHLQLSSPERLQTNTGSFVCTPSVTTLSFIQHVPPCVPSWLTTHSSFPAWQSELQPPPSHRPV